MTLMSNPFWVRWSNVDETNSAHTLQVGFGKPRANLGGKLLRKDPINYLRRLNACQFHVQSLKLDREL